MCLPFGCSKDDPDDPDNKVPDPPGTVTANLSDRTKISVRNNTEIYWYTPDNLILYGYNSGDYLSICNLGAMSGLGNITKIPTSGFTAPSRSDSSVACEAGHGYVIKFERYDGSNIEYLRLYVVESIVSTTGGIMGAKVKYQYPFVP
jgi:hypothetical protein